MTDRDISNSTADAIVSQIIEEHAQKVAAQTLRTVTMDEQALIQCLDFYNAVVKHPITGELHKKHAETLIWMLGHVGDAALAQCAETLENFKPMNTARQCCARMAGIILKRRGVGRSAIIVN